MEECRSRAAVATVSDHDRRLRKREHWDSLVSENLCKHLRSTLLELRPEPRPVYLALEVSYGDKVPDVFLVFGITPQRVESCSALQCEISAKHLRTRSRAAQEHSLRRPRC